MTPLTPTPGGTVVRPTGPPSRADRTTPRQGGTILAVPALVWYLVFMVGPLAAIFVIAALHWPGMLQPVSLQFKGTVPREMEEAARLDGASTYAVLRHVYAPMCLPGIATVLLLNFLTFWNEYLHSLVIIGPDPAQRTVQVALPTLTAITGTDYGVLTAGTVLTLVPVWIVYTVLQKRMQLSLVSGAVTM